MSKLKQNLKYDVLFGVMVSTLAVILEYFMFHGVIGLQVIAVDFVVGTLASFVARNVAKHFKIRPRW